MTTTAWVELGPAAHARLAAIAQRPDTLFPSVFSMVGVPVQIIDDGRDPMSWRAISADGSVVAEGLL